MHDPLQHARELARHWREANGAAGGHVIFLGGEFVGWLPELPPAGSWAAGCLAFAEDGHAWLIDRTSWREPLQWFDLDPPPVAAADPPPSPSESPESETTTEP